MRSFEQLGQKHFALAFRGSCPDTSLIECPYRADLALALVSGETTSKDVPDETRSWLAMCKSDGRGRCVSSTV